MRLTAGVRDKISDGVNRKVLKWLGQVERMTGERLTKRVDGIRGRG